MDPLRREVLVPVPTYRRPSSVIGLSIVLVLLASAVDAVVWSYQAVRTAEERAAKEDLGSAGARAAITPRPRKCREALRATHAINTEEAGE